MHLTRAFLTKEKEKKKIRPIRCECLRLSLRYVILAKKK